MNITESEIEAAIIAQLLEEFADGRVDDFRIREPQARHIAYRIIDRLRAWPGRVLSQADLNEAITRMRNYDEVARDNDQPEAAALSSDTPHLEKSLRAVQGFFTAEDAQEHALRFAPPGAVKLVRQISENNWEWYVERP